MTRQGDSTGTPRGALGAVLNRWTELREIWYIGVFGMLFHVMESVFMYDPQGDLTGTPRGLQGMLWGQFYLKFDI